METFGERLEWALAQRKWKQARLAQELGVTRTAVSQWVTGKSDPSSANLRAAASVLDVSSEWLGTGRGEPRPAGSAARVRDVGDLEPIPRQLGMVRVDGKVQAGSFVEKHMLDPLPDDYVSAPKDPDFPFARQIAFRVGGDSMNRARPKPISEGDVIVCVLWEDLGIEITDGMNVVVQREMDGGHLVERSVKEVRVLEDGFEFLPRSSNAAYQPFRIGRDLEADDGKQVRVLALVRFVFDHQPLPVIVKRLAKT